MAERTTNKKGREHLAPNPRLHHVCISLSFAVGRPSFTAHGDQHCQFILGNGDTLETRANANQGVVVFFLELHIIQIGYFVVKVERVGGTDFIDNHLAVGSSNVLGRVKTRVRNVALIGAYKQIRVCGIGIAATCRKTHD